MTVEIEYSNPTTLGLGEWQVAMAEEMMSNVPEQAPISSLRDIEREVVGSTLVVRVPGDENVPVDALRNVIESSLPAAAHVETRTV